MINCYFKLRIKEEMNGRGEKGKKGGGKEERRKGGKKMREIKKRRREKGEIKQRPLLGFPYTFNIIFVYVI